MSSDVLLLLTELEQKYPIGSLVWDRADDDRGVVIGYELRMRDVLVIAYFGNKGGEAAREEHVLTLEEPEKEDWQKS